MRNGFVVALGLSDIDRGAVVCDRRDGQPPLNVLRTCQKCIIVFSIHIRTFDAGARVGGGNSAPRLRCIRRRGSRRRCNLREDGKTATQIPGGETLVALATRSKIEACFSRSCSTNRSKRSRKELVLRRKRRFAATPTDVVFVLTGIEPT